MSFVDMTSEEWEAVRKHHDALIEMAELELQADQIRESGTTGRQLPELESIEAKLQQLGDEIEHLAA